MTAIKALIHETEVRTPIIYDGAELCDYGISTLGEIFKKDQAGLWTNLEVTATNNFSIPMTLICETKNHSVIDIYADTFKKSYAESASIVKQRSNNFKSNTYCDKFEDLISITLDRYKIIYGKYTQIFDIYLDGKILSGDWGSDALVEALDGCGGSWFVHKSPPLEGIYHKLALEFVKSLEDYELYPATYEREV